MTQAVADAAASQVADARSAKANRSWFAARFHLDQRIAADPDNLPLILETAEVSAELGDFQRAARDFGRASKSPKANALVFFNRALTCLGNEDQAGYRDAVRLAMEQFFAQHRVKPRIVMEIPSNETIKQAVMAGMGLSFLSLRTARQEIAGGHRQLDSHPPQRLFRA